MKHDHNGITLGAKVLCRVTGFIGIVTGITDYLNGCTRCMVEPHVDDDGKMLPTQHFDVAQLTVESADPTQLVAKQHAIADFLISGGPPRSEPQRW